MSCEPAVGLTWSTAINMRRGRPRSVSWVICRLLDSRARWLAMLAEPARGGEPTIGDLAAAERPKTSDGSRIADNRREGVTRQPGGE